LLQHKFTEEKETWVLNIPPGTCIQRKSVMSCSEMPPGFLNNNGNFRGFKSQKFLSFMVVRAEIQQIQTTFIKNH